MPALPVIADVFRCTLNWRRGISATAHNVIHILAFGGDSASVYAALDASVTAAMWDFVVNDSEVTSVTVLPLDGTSAGTTFNTGEPEKWSGQSTGTDAIPQGCGVVSLQTGLRGREHRGRVYLPWVAEGEQTNGALLDVAACQTAWELFASNLVSHEVALGVASYKLASFTVLESLVIHPFLRTQRRRALR